MPSYANLQLNRYYLLQENDNEDLILVQPVLQTNNCVMLLLHADNAHTSFWRKKTAGIVEIADELTDEQAAAYQAVYAEGTEVYEVTEDDEDDWDEQ